MRIRELNDLPGMDDFFENFFYSFQISHPYLEDRLKLCNGLKTFESS